MKFTEQITQLWNNEELDNDTKLATLLDMTKNYVPKARIDEYAKRVSILETEKEQLSTEYDEFKKSKMTDDERIKAEKDDMESRSKNLSLKESEYAVRDLFTNANISKEKYEKILSKVVSKDKDKSVEIAQTFIELLGETADETKKKTVTELLNDTPKPTVSTPNGGTVSNADAYQEKFDEAVKNNDLIGQAQYMRMIQEEQAKINTPGV